VLHFYEGTAVKNHFAEVGRVKYPKQEMYVYFDPEHETDGDRSTDTNQSRLRLFSRLVISASIKMLEFFL